MVMMVGMVTVIFGVGIRHVKLVIQAVFACSLCRRSRKRPIGCCLLKTIEPKWPRELRAWLWSMCVWSRWSSLAPEVRAKPLA